MAELFAQRKQGRRHTLGTNLGPGASETASVAEQRSEAPIRHARLDGKRPLASSSLSFSVAGR